MAIGRVYETTFERIVMTLKNKKIHPSECFDFIRNLYPIWTHNYIDTSIISGCMNFIFDKCEPISEIGGVCIYGSDSCNILKIYKDRYYSEVICKEGCNNIIFAIQNFHTSNWCRISLKTDREVYDYKGHEAQCAKMIMDELGFVISYYYRKYYLGQAKFKW